MGVSNLAPIISISKQQKLSSLYLKLYFKKLCILFATKGLMKNYIIRWLWSMWYKGVRYMYLKIFISKFVTKSMTG